MKKLFILAFILSFPLVHLSISQISSATEIPPMSPSSGSTSACDLDSYGIQAIQFYMANCPSTEDRLVEFCAWSGLAYHSYCHYTPCISTGVEGGFDSISCIPVPPESAQACIERHGCATSTAPSPGTSSGPTLTSLSPSTIQEGSAAFTLQVTGTHFTSVSAVLWNGRIKPSTFVSETALSAQISAEDVVRSGNVEVKVLSNATRSLSDTPQSNALTFSITARGSTPSVPTSPVGTTTTPNNPAGTTPANPDSGTPIGIGDTQAGGCVLGAENNSAMGFTLFGMSFGIGSILLLRRRK